MICQGNLNDHCCWINGKVCPFLEENTVQERRWACGLYRELGSWNSVHSDSRYLEHIRPMFEKWRPDRNCGEWLYENEMCNTCGITNQ